MGVAGLEGLLGLWVSRIWRVFCGSLGIVVKYRGAGGGLAWKGRGKRHEG